MNYFYSPSKNTFYNGEIKDDYYDVLDAWPADCQPVEEAIYHEFYLGCRDGFMMQPGNDGMPSWVALPPPSKEELIAAANAEKQLRISQANDYMNSKQWPGKAAIGRLSGEELAQYTLWLDYLDALSAINTSTAPDITWPPKPE